MHFVNVAMPVKQPTSVACALSFLAVATSLVPASAQGPATIRGVVYSCSSHHALVNVPVRLRNLDDGITIPLRSNENGRFTRVGLPHGRYLIEATAPAAFASRIATVETDDVLDVYLGTELQHGGARAGDPADRAPHPICDAPRVPAVVPTSDRYIIH